MAELLESAADIGDFEAEDGRLLTARDGGMDGFVEAAA
jgi:hypothetical protein